MKLLNKLTQHFKRESTQSIYKLPGNPKIIPRNKHNISRQYISKNALSVLYKLREHGYQAYLVGGGVRDLLLGREPKDFDVVTNAKPTEIKACFRHGKLIGRRFLLVHILFKNEIIEVSTFRALSDADLHDTSLAEHNMITYDNIYGTIEQDAARRDFTINALFYNIEDFSVIDYHQGIEDLNQGILRIIGEPIQRFREDPARMLRAVRFVVKLGFRLDPETEAAIQKCKHLLSHVSKARLFTEILKLFMEGKSAENFEFLCRHHLFTFLFPMTEPFLHHNNMPEGFQLITRGLQNMDNRVAESKTVTPAFLIAIMLWPVLQDRIKTIEAQGEARFAAFHSAANEAFTAQKKIIIAPQHFFNTARMIWEMQEHFSRRRRHKVTMLTTHPRFRAALDFLSLRAEVNPHIESLAQWWREFSMADEKTRKEMLTHLPSSKRKQKKTNE